MFIKKSLTNYSIIKLDKEFQRGAYEEHTAKEGNDIECGVMNLETSKACNSGTHWVCYHKNNHWGCYYFDSFGLDPPIELRNWLNSQIELLTSNNKKPIIL